MSQDAAVCWRIGLYLLALCACIGLIRIAVGR